MSEKIFIISGESSGEMYGASLIKELLLLNNSFEISGIGGQNFIKAGAKILFNYSDINFIGFSAILKNIFIIKKRFNICVEYVRSTNPSAVILIDFPGFNLKFIKEIRKFYQGKIIYYISPQLWAWHKSRIKIIQDYVDKMLVIFPFEVEFYKNENVEAEYVGHPLKERTDLFLIDADNKINISNTKVLTLMPGSRREEVERILPVLIEASSFLKKEFDLKLNLLCSGNLVKSFYEKFVIGHNIELIYDDGTKRIEFETIYKSDLLFTKSGTSTVECALLKSPFCIVYKAGFLNYIIGKYLLKLKNIGMVNILLNKNAVKEFIQGECNKDNLIKEGRKILQDEEYRNEMIKNFDKLDELLGNKKASENAAKIIYNQIE